MGKVSGFSSCSTDNQGEWDMPTLRCLIQSFPNSTYRSAIAKKRPLRLPVAASRVFLIEVLPSGSIQKNHLFIC